MYGIALALSATTTAATVGMPYFKLGAIGPVQSFGLIVAVGVLVGAALLRRYAEWHGVSDDHIRRLLGWVTVCGFLGAHEFDMIAYNWDKIWQPVNEAPPGWWFLPQGLWVENWPLPLRIWEGISSYGGFLGGAMGFAYYVWRNRLPVRLFADITIVGLLVAFSIGRIACTVVSDHIGAAVDPNAWYAPLAMDYPRSAGFDAIREITPAGYDQPTILAWNLGLIELLWLIPINILILWLAFRPTKRMPAGFIVALTGVLYAPVRFFLEYLRPESTDPRHLGLTFAQWCSLVAFVVAVGVAARVLKKGKPAEPVTRTAREAQERLRMILKEDEEDAQSKKQGTKPNAASKGGGGNKKKLDRREMAKAIAAKPDPAPTKQQTPEERKADLLAAIKREKPQEPKKSANVEEPAEEGGEVDPKEALAARKAESDATSTTDDKKSKTGDKTSKSSDDK